MKTKLLLSIVLMLAAMLEGYSQDCTTPLSSVEYRQLYNQLTTIRNDQQRLNRSQSIFSGKCLLTYQVKEVAQLYTDEIIRLAFVKDIYPSIFDKENIYDVYDAFTSFSTAFMLYDYVKEADGKTPPKDTQGQGEHQKSAFPNYDYPDALKYTGKKQCNEPLTDDTFDALVKNIRHRDETSQQRMTADMVDKYCLSVAQLMKLSTLLEPDESRIQLLKHAYAKVYDVENYGYCKQVFQSSKARIDFTNYLAELQRTNTNNAAASMGKAQKAKCDVTDDELKEILSTIKQQSFGSTKMAVGKQAVEAKKCFEVEQIKQIVVLFAHDSEKLDMAKYCYDFCVDKSNYYQLNSVFSFSSSVSQLTQYVKSKQ